MLLAIGHKSLRVGVELVKRAFDVGARPGDEFLELNAPVVAKIRPLWILPEIDRRYFSCVSQSLTTCRQSHGNRASNAKHSRPSRAGRAARCHRRHDPGHAASAQR